jgi:hypothetical protein
LVDTDITKGEPGPPGSFTPPVLSERMVIMGRPMRRSEIEELAISVRVLLSDPEADINEPLRRRWEGALAVLEAILGERSSLVDNLGSDLL